MILNLYVVTTVVTLLVLFLSAWKPQRWLSVTSFALVATAALVFYFQEQYFEFSFYLLQVLLLLFGTAFFVRGRRQKLLLGGSIAILVACWLAKDSLRLDHLATIEYTVWLYAAFALLPLLFFSPVSGKEENLESILCLQQTWLRLLFFHWAYGQGVNISHYELYGQYVLIFGAVAVVVILLSTVFRKNFFWTLAQQSVLSILVLSVCLDRVETHANLVFVWIMLLALSSLVPKPTIAGSENRTRFLKRLEYGAFGGGVFWSLLFVVHLGSENSILGSMLWTVIVFLLGFFSWLRDLPASHVEGRTPQSEFILFGTRALVQVLLTTVFILPL